MPDSTSQADIHAEALQRFDKAQSAQREEREQCLQDRRFYSIAGAQWEGALGEQFASKPKFEVNKIHRSVIRIISEYRNNRITVDFVPRSGDSTDKLADACDGLYRADEQDSAAEEAYDNAFEEAVGGGFGAWRLRAEYEEVDDEDDDRQRIRIEPIYDADSCVFFDPNAKRQDKRDAKYCFVLVGMTVDAYKNKYDDNPTTWPKEITKAEFDWFTENVVYVAEYYCIEETSEVIRVFERLDGTEERYRDSDLEQDEELVESLRIIGTKEVRQRKVQRQRVHKYIMSGGMILEDGGIIAGNCIPIVPTYGKRWFVDNVERCMGHVRLAKDAQRLKNMQLSRLGEISTLSPVEKPIFTTEQIAGLEKYWSLDNIENYPYLVVNPVTDAAGNMQPIGALGYTKAPQLPPALTALYQATEADMQDLLGGQEAAEKLQPNLSAKAIELIQTRLDMQTFIYMSNFAKAIKRSGEIWLSMARDVYVEPGRKMKSIGKQEEVGFIELSKPVIDEDTGKLIYANDLSKAKYDVFVDVGPSTHSRKAATLREIIGMLQVTTDQETKLVLEAFAMMNMEGEGIGEAQDYFRQKLIRLGVVKPSPEEAKQLMALLQAQQQQPDPQSLYLQSAAMAEQARAQESQADTALKLAKAEETKAKTLEIVTELGRQPPKVERRQNASRT